MYKIDADNDHEKLKYYRAGVIRKANHADFPKMVYRMSSSLPGYGTLIALTNDNGSSLEVVAEKEFPDTNLVKFNSVGVLEDREFVTQMIEKIMMKPGM